MFCEWRKFVASEQRHFVLKFEAGFGGYRIFITDFERLWIEEVQSEAQLSEILKERAGSFEVDASEFVKILQQMIQSLPTSFVSFDEGKLVLSHKLGFIKFNWTFQAQLDTKRLPKFLFHDIIVPLLRESNLSTSSVLEEADIQLLNRLKFSHATTVTKAIEVPVTSSVTSPPDQTQAETQTTTAPTTIVAAPAIAPEPESDPAAVEATKRKELEDRLAASHATKKKKRLL